MKRTVVLFTLIATLFAACGDDDTAEGPVGVSDAVEAEGEITVTGSLFVLTDDTVVLSELVAESFPPQPGGATITVVGLDLGGIALEEAPEGSELSTIKWSGEPVTLTGSMEAGTLTDAELK